jgi:hypothetical protein
LGSPLFKTDRYRCVFPLFAGGVFGAASMNHSLYSADRETYRRTIGSAFVAIFIVTLLGVAVISKFEREPARPSVAVLRAGIPLDTTDGGYIIIR